MLFSGDHLLKGIFPLITAWDLQVDYLQRYVDTLSALKNLNIHTVLPAHRGRDIDVCERVEAAISYHERQLESIRHILKRHGWMNAYQVARHMQWNMHGTFDGYSKMQTWFACSEALAHLQHLYFCGEVRKKPYSVPNLFCLEDSI